MYFLHVGSPAVTWMDSHGSVTNNEWRFIYTQLLLLLESKTIWTVPWLMWTNVCGHPSQLLTCFSLTLCPQVVLKTSVTLMLHSSFLPCYHCAIEAQLSHEVMDHLFRLYNRELNIRSFRRWVSVAELLDKA